MPTTRAVTADEFLAMGEGRRELVRGEVIEMTPAGYEHGRVSLRLGRLLARFIEEQGLGEAVGAETGFILARNPDTVRAPDVAFISRGRIPREQEMGYLELAPDLVVEVVSPNDTFTSVEDKVQEWLTHGVRTVWVVDPRLLRVIVHRGDGSVQDLGPEDRLVGGDVLPGFDISVADCFRRADS